MSVSIHIEGATALAVRAEMEALLANTGKPASSDVIAAPPAAPSTGVDGEVVPPAPKTRGRKKADKADKPAEQIEDAEVVEETTDAPAESETSGKPEPTVDDVRAALLALNKAKGDDAVFAVLSELGVKNATGIIEAGKAAEAIEKCNERAAV